MKKFLLSALVLIIFTGYAVGTNLNAKENRTVSVKALDVFIPSPISSSTPVSTSNPAPAGMGMGIGPAMMQRYRDGAYTGSVADAFYGNIQVQVVISGGKITDVIFLQYPSDRRTSIEINSQAIPFLKQEAIQAQSAQVAGVTGATATSQAFIQSLSSALQQAS